MSEQSTSTANTSTNDDSLKEKREFRMTPEKSRAVIRIIKEKMNRATDELENGDIVKEPERCRFCLTRRGRFFGDTCSDLHPLCKHCCYSMILSSLEKYTDGPLSAQCPHCFHIISSLIRRKRRSTNDNYQDENQPDSRHADRSISICDYAESMCLDGHVNGAYESSSSL